MKSDIIGSVDRALEILLALYDNGREMGISELSEQLNVYKSTVFRTLKTLEERDFIRQNPDTKNYWFGMKLYAIGLTVGEKMHLKDIIAPHTQRLYDECQEIVNASVLETIPGEFHQSIVIHKEVGSRHILYSNQPLGSSSPCYCSSVGKCLLAFTKGVNFDVYRIKPMKKFSEKTIVDPAVFLKTIEDVRKNGYALDDEERESGLTCIGAPVLDRDGNAIAAISMSGPTSRLQDGHLDEKIEKVVKTAQAISKEFR